MNFIGGIWCAALDGRTFMRLNPARPDDVVGHFPDSGPADAESAASSAAQAYPAWRETMPTARGEVLHRAGDLIAGRVGELATALAAGDRKRPAWCGGTEYAGSRAQNQLTCAWIARLAEPTPDSPATTRSP